MGAPVRKNKTLTYSAQQEKGMEKLSYSLAKDSVIPLKDERITSGGM